MTPDDFTHDVLPWIMSVITLYMTYQQGRKRWWAWAVGLINQALWLWFAIRTETWGLLLLNAGLWWLYIRNLRIWYNDEKNHKLLQASASCTRPPTMEEINDLVRAYATTDELKR